MSLSMGGQKAKDKNIEIKECVVTQFYQEVHICIFTQFF